MTTTQQILVFIWIIGYVITYGAYVGSSKPSFHDDEGYYKFVESSAFKAQARKALWVGVAIWPFMLGVLLGSREVEACVKRNTRLIEQLHSRVDEMQRATETRVQINRSSN